MRDSRICTDSSEWLEQGAVSGDEVRNRRTDQIAKIQCAEQRCLHSAMSSMVRFAFWDDSLSYSVEDDPEGILEGQKTSWKVTEIE